MRCPSCGFSFDGLAARCPRCDAPLVAAVAPPGAASTPATVTPRQRMISWAIAGAAATAVFFALILVDITLFFCIDLNFGGTPSDSCAEKGRDSAIFLWTVVIPGTLVALAATGVLVERLFRRRNGARRRGTTL